MWKIGAEASFKVETKDPLGAFNKLSTSPLWIVTRPRDKPRYCVKVLATAFVLKFAGLV